VEQTTLEFRIAEGDREVIGRLSTKDEAVLYRAISALETLAGAASPVATWDQGSDRWESSPALPPAPADQRRPTDL
jgi:hypothetical protein